MQAGAAAVLRTHLHELEDGRLADLRLLALERAQR